MGLYYRTLVLQVGTNPQNPLVKVTREHSIEGAETRSSEYLCRLPQKLFIVLANYINTCIAIL